MINLTKGSGPVSLAKGPGIVARISWPAKTDYDLGAEILYRDGTSESIATFPAKNTNAQMASRNKTVTHGGDAVRGAGRATEMITIIPDPEIAAIVPWAYSAQSNGTGSFRKYAVSMEVTDGTNTVKIDASNASDHRNVYTCVPGMIRFAEDGTPQVEYLEAYSKPGSECRPEFRREEQGGGLFRKPTLGDPVLTVDGSRRNAYK